MVDQSKIIWNPYSPGYFENPYIHLKECREQNPIHEVFNNSWIFLNYSEVNEILSSKKFLVSELSKFLQEKESYIFKNSSACPYLATGTKMWTTFLNDKVHKDARVVMGKSLNLLNLDKVLDDSVELLNKQYGPEKDFDLVTYCSEFIYLVLKEILGINSFEEFHKIKTYSNMLAKSQDLYVPKQVYLEINDWLLWGKDIFSDSEFRKRLIEFSTEADLNYSEEDIYSITSLTLMAAFETSKDNLSLALYEVMQKPELVDYIIACDKQELDLVIEELFRFTSPLQYTIRVNKEPLEIEDKHIPANSKLYLSLASANRDEAVFKTPNEIIVDRTPNNHLSFGKGMHFCLGATIARQELRHCLKPMVKFLSNYKLNNSQPPKWSRQIFMRTVESIMVEHN